LRYRSASRFDDDDPHGRVGAVDKRRQTGDGRGAYRRRVRSCLPTSDQPGRHWVSISKCISAVVALTAATAAQGAADWVTIKANDQNVTFYVDRASVKTEGALVTFWESMVFAKPSRKDDVSGKLIKEKRVYRVMHCINRTQGFRYGATYGENGKLIEALTVDEAHVEMAPVASGSVADGELNLVCDVAARTQ
jgi:hypothetical protein